ncbi:uncharacterized protein LOC119680178 [Teleopsis dalmanni]|nr:uncharacterized protein LOC119680178 [Teleopsis dalmanni]
MMEKFVKTVNIMDDTILVPCRLMDRQVGDSSDIIPAPGKDSTSNQHTFNSITNGKRSVAQSKNVHEFLTSSELFNLYNMLNSLKNDLLWTGKDNSEEEEDPITNVQNKINELNKGARLSPESEPKTDNSNTEVATNATNTTTTVASTTITKGHIRRPSTASVTSTASGSNISDSESEVSNENDSGVESEVNKASSISSSEDLCAQKKKAANADKATELAQRCKRHLNGLYQCLEQMTEAANYLTARYQSDIGPV